MNHVTKYLKFIIVINITIFFTSCSLLKSQEQKTLDDIKQIAKLNFEMQFRSNKKTRRGKDDKYVYFYLVQNKNFVHFLNDNNEIKRIVTDASMLSLLFNQSEIKYYKEKLKDIENLNVIENFILSDSIRKKPIIDNGREILNERVFYMMIPVFTINGNYAITIGGLDGNYSILYIYKKEGNLWTGAYAFMIGIS